MPHDMHSRFTMTYILRRSREDSEDLVPSNIMILFLKYNCSYMFFCINAHFLYCEKALYCICYWAVKTF